MNHRFQINTKLIRILSFIKFVYPICFTFYLIPALGVCKSYEHLYSFGAIWIYYTNSAFGLRNSFFNLYSIFFWMAVSAIVNIVLLIKVIKAKAQIIQSGTNSYKAEISITITTVATLIFYVVNAVFVLVYIFCYGTDSYSSYTIIVRPFGNDMQTCIISWVFYLTHPVFKRSTIYPTTTTIEIATSFSPE
uniref:Serpentine receptor class gamma n=2 Tax=Caenorhabditis tropicalis TaxID=1561998 RepID=A0A1I7UDE0_9PELO